MFQRWPHEFRAMMAGFVIKYTAGEGLELKYQELKKAANQMLG